MKIFKMMMTVLAISSSGLMAQDYYAPTDKEKELVARFPVKEIKVKTRADGQKFISYELPTVLTGETNSIVANEVDVGGLPPGVRVFSSDQAIVTCMGTEEKPGCMVRHLKLNLNKTLAYAEIDRTYYDRISRENAKLVVNEFHGPVEHSGNQPIGILGGLKPLSDEEREALNKPVLGTFITKYELANGRTIFAKITLKENGNGVGGQYKYSPTLPTGINGDTWEAVQAEGKFTNVQYFGNRVIGKWSAGANGGWLEFTFNKSRTTFEGYYGIGQPGSPRLGRWTSLSVQ